MKVKVTLRTMLAMSLLLCGLTASRTHAVFTTFLEPGFVQQDIITGFPTVKGLGILGPTGIVVLTNGDFVIVNKGDNALYRFPSTGGVVSPANIIIKPADLDGLAFADDGNLYGTRFNLGAIFRIDLVTNTKTSLVDGLLRLTLGIAADPISGDLFVSEQFVKRLMRFTPSTNALQRLFSRNGFLRPDGVAVTCDGLRIFVADLDLGIMEVARTGGPPTLFVAIPGNGADGIAIGRPGTALQGFIFVNTITGKIFKIKLSDGAVSLFADGGSRGDFITTDLKGNLYATQSDRIVKISPTVPASGSFIFPGGNVCDTLTCAARALCGPACRSNQGICGMLLARIQMACDKAETSPRAAKAELDAIANQIQRLRRSGQLACPGL